MAYVIDIAKALTDTLRVFTSLNAHQLAGHVANLDFWLGEVRHCLQVIDGYGDRFEQLKAAQMSHVTRKGTFQFELDDDHEHLDSAESIPPPKRNVKDSELKELRRSVRDATYRFLVRCYNERLLEKPVLLSAPNRVDVEVEENDLQH